MTPKTLTLHTASGGTHYVFRAPTKVAPWKGQTLQCSGCGRLTIHTGPCAHCGQRIK